MGRGPRNAVKHYYMRLPGAYGVLPTCLSVCWHEEPQ